ncbi:hypothetical protein SLEP1_g58015 [Rubroshorea leprosula]|uniref:Uncharacterized protein n=1 Tax=Rubroshorea leprosula TaxID=152421 RepID=A0AAV5MR83_9ROSI|nr:hypothetical protein SLEP1_g58015 [Rubroshorea leprosula]
MPPVVEIFAPRQCRLKSSFYWPHSINVPTAEKLLKILLNHYGIVHLGVFQGRS